MLEWGRAETKGFFKAITDWSSHSSELKKLMKKGYLN